MTETKNLFKMAGQEAFISAKAEQSKVVLVKVSK